jgi:hypothetical protein
MAHESARQTLDESIGLHNPDYRKEQNMIRKFLEGLVFGAGFAIPFTIITFVANYWLTPSLMTSEPDRSGGEVVALPNEDLASIAARLGVATESEIPFHELSVEDQIMKSSVIALAEFEPAADGKMRAVIREFLKKEPGTTIYYEVGDEFQPSSYYPKAGTSHGDGTVIFFAGSPARMRMSMSYDGDRISGLGDLPIRLFREKCAKPEDSTGKN